MIMKWYVISKLYQDYSYECFELYFPRLDTICGGSVLYDWKLINLELKAAASTL